MLHEIHIRIIRFYSAPVHLLHACNLTHTHTHTHTHTRDKQHTRILVHKYKSKHDFTHICINQNQKGNAQITSDSEKGN